MPTLYTHRPADETHRLEALRPYQLITAIPNVLTDELVRLTATLFNAPIAIIALVEEHTVQFRLNVGLPADTQRENRDESLCSVAILQEGITVFEDLLLDPCELAQPGLVQRLNLQFYAGSPLLTGTGFPVGVLCILDHQPRTFAEEDRALLTQLARVVMQMLDSRVQLAYQGELNWQTLYDQIETSVMRLSTLAALAKWEDHEQTPAAIAYRQSTRDEISRVLATLQKSLTDAA